MRENDTYCKDCGIVMSKDALVLKNKVGELSKSHFCPDCSKKSHIY